MKLLEWFEDPKISSLETQYQCVPKELLLWNDKALLKGSFLVWDFENIGISFFEAIKACVAFTPEKLYLMCKHPISTQNRALLEARGFILFENYPGSADEKIIDLIKVHQGCTHLILISSDSDFVPAVHRYLENHHVQWIMNDCNKKRICMKINLAHPRLKITTIFWEAKPKEIAKKAAKQKKHPTSQMARLRRFLQEMGHELYE